MNDSSPSDISSTAGKEHPVASATLEHFTVKDNGQEYFVLNDKEWPASQVKVDILRKFAGRNNVKRSESPYLSLGRGSTKSEIIQEIKMKIARRDNAQPDP
jgi:hypothetical protein